MTLLQEIEALASDPRADVPALLRKCLVLATRLQHDDFRTWTTHELNGYSNGAALPAYRKGYEGTLRGTVANRVYRHTNVTLDWDTFPVEIRDEWRLLSFPQSVAELEAMNRSDRPIGLNVPSALWGHLEEGINPGYSIQELRVFGDRAAVAGILDKVRTAALLFALEIERLNPSAGEGGPTGTMPIPLEDVDRAFRSTILSEAG